MTLKKKRAAELGDFKLSNKGGREGGSLYSKVPNAAGVL